MEERRTEAITLREIRNTPEILNAAFDFIRQNNRSFRKGLLLYVFPFLLLSLFLYQFVVLGFLNSIIAELPGSRTSLLNEALLSTQNPLVNGLLTLTAIGTYLSGVTLLIAFVHAFVKVYMRAGGMEVDLKEVRRETQDLFWTVLGTNIGLVVLSVALFLALAFMVGIIGAISYVFAGLLSLGMLAGFPIILVTYSLYYPVRFVEENTFASSFSRSSQLISGRWWRTCGLLLACFGVVMALSIFARLPATLMELLSALHLITIAPYDVVNPSSLWRIVGATATVLFGTAIQLIGVVPLLSLILHYYSQVERQESVGLGGLADLIGVREETLP